MRSTHNKERAMPATSPAATHELWRDGINRGDLEALITLYEEQAAFVPSPGSVVHGKDAVREVLTGFLALRGTAKVETRRIVEGPDLALVVSDWTLDGTGLDGTPASLSGTTADVVRKQPDGRWLIALDNPFGVI